jgi:hypothetical protein
MQNPEIQDSKSKANAYFVPKTAGIQRNYSTKRISMHSPLASIAKMNYFKPHDGVAKTGDHHHP